MCRVIVCVWSTLFLKNIFAIINKNPCLQHNMEIAWFFFSRPFYCPNLRAWGAELQIRCCTHFISINKARGALRQNSPLIFWDLGGSNSEGNSKRRRGNFEQDKALTFEAIRDIFRPKPQSTVQILTYCCISIFFFPCLSWWIHECTPHFNNWRRETREMVCYLLRYNHLVQTPKKKNKDSREAFWVIWKTVLYQSQHMGSSGSSGTPVRFFYTTNAPEKNTINTSLSISAQLKEVSKKPGSP